VTHAREGLFQHSTPIRLILGSFFILTIPLCLLAAWDDRWSSRWSPGTIYLGALGMTHFLITFAVYFQAANRRHFGSNRADRVLFFLVPPVLFLAFALYYALGVAAVWPTFHLVLLGAIRLADFHHFTRQSYGVLQLFQRRTGCRFPDWMARAESHYFNGLALLLFVTFLTRGRFRPESTTGPVVLALVLGLLAWVFLGYLWAWRRAHSGARAGLPVALAYLLLQSGSAALAAFSTSLYAFSLAMHYVEYHVLMAPRCFAVPLDLSTRIDRLWARIRRHKVLFYLVLGVLAVPMARLAWMGMGVLVHASEAASPLPYRLLISIFDGMFVVHFLIESRIWRFHDPYFRSQLVPLYFGSVPARVGTELEPEREPVLSSCP
jgi:hypothetical protein